MASNSDLIQASAGQLASWIREGEVSSVEVVEAHIERIEKTHQRLNAVVWRLFDEARARAAELDAASEPVGPLHGVPVSIKEQFLVRGTPSTWGLRHRANHRADREGTLVTRLRAAGAIPLVKTNVPQLLIAHETDNALYGRTNNPWNESRSPGGSSGGESALIASYGSPLGLGGDLGGSIRVPCHFAGIAGLKPTAGRLPGDDNPHDIGNPPELIVAQAGPMARHVADLALAMEVLVGQPGPSPTTPMVPWKAPASGVDGLRIGVQKHDGFVTPSPAIQRAVEEAGKALADRGAEVVEWSFKAGVDGFHLFLGLLGADGFASMRRALDGEKPHPLVANLLRGASAPRPMRAVLGPMLKAAGQPNIADLIHLSGNVTAAELFERMATRFRLREKLAAELRNQRIDALIVPPYGTVAPPHGASANAPQLACYAFTYNVFGNPAGVVPITRVRKSEECERKESWDAIVRQVRSIELGSEGMPAGVQVVGPWWRDDIVLQVMAALEDAFHDSDDYPRRPL